jgi:hypothetical protein
VAGTAVNVLVVEGVAQRAGQPLALDGPVEQTETSVPTVRSARAEVA